MKLSSACFGCFECTFPIAKLNHSNQLQKNRRYIPNYVESVFNYFDDFKMTVIYATMKIEIMIENGWSLKLRQS